MRKSLSNVARRAVSASVAAAGEADRAALDQWARLAQRERLNPCNSPLHPAAKAGVVPPQPGARALSVQEAYDPQGIDFACGPAHPTGLRLRSFRTEHGLQSHVVVPDAYQELPGILSPGILCTLISCHANWASSIALMDKAILPRPPLMAVLRLAVDFNVSEYAQPGQPLTLTSRVVEVQDGHEPYAVDIAVHLRGGSGEGEGKDEEGGPLFASALASFHKIGAVRSLR